MTAKWDDLGVVSGRSFDTVFAHSAAKGAGVDVQELRRTGFSVNSPAGFTKCF